MASLSPKASGKVVTDEFVVMVEFFQIRADKSKSALFSQGERTDSASAHLHSFICYKDLSLSSSS